MNLTNTAFDYTVMDNGNIDEMFGTIFISGKLDTDSYFDQRYFFHPILHSMRKNEFKCIINRKPPFIIVDDNGIVQIDREYLFIVDKEGATVNKILLNELMQMESAYYIKEQEKVSLYQVKVHEGGWIIEFKRPRPSQETLKLLNKPFDDPLDSEILKKLIVYDQGKVIYNCGKLAKHCQEEKLFFKVTSDKYLGEKLICRIAYEKNGPFLIVFTLNGELVEGKSLNPFKNPFKKQRAPTPKKYIPKKSKCEQSPPEKTSTLTASQYSDFMEKRALLDLNICLSDKSASPRKIQEAREEYARVTTHLVGSDIFD